jgi:WD40 repeat protein
VVDSVTFSSDGRLLAGAGPDGQVKVWNVASGREVLTRRFSPGGETGAVAFSSDGTVLAVMRHEFTRFWRMPDGLELRTIAGKQSAFSPATRLVAAGTDRETSVWDVVTGRRVHHLRDVGGARAFSPDGTRLATGLPTLALWDLSSGREQRLPSPYRPLSVTFAPDGTQMVIVSKADNMAGELASVIDVSDGKLRQHLIHGGGGVQSAFSRDNSRLATSSADGVVRVWDQVAGVQRIYRGHTSTVAGVAFSPDGRHVASAGLDGVAILWDSTRDPRGTAMRPRDAWSGEALAAWTFTPEGREVYSVYLYGGRLLRQDAVTGQLLSEKHMAIDAKPIYPRGDVAFSADVRLLAGALRSDRRVVQVWDAKTARPLAAYRGHAGTLGALAFRPDGRRIASSDVQAGPTTEIHIWDSDTGQERLRIPKFAQLLCALAFSPDGTRLASGGALDGTVRLWDVDTGRQLLELPGCKQLVCLAFNPRGDRLAAADLGGDRLRVWDTTTGKEVLAVPCPRSLTGVAFSTDGKRLVATGFDSTVRLWDAASGQEVLVLRSLVDDRRSEFGFTGRVVFSPDGGRLAANVWNGFINVWDSGERQRRSD